MSLLKKFKDLNNFSDKDIFVKLICKDTEVGLVHPKIVNLILESKLPYYHRQGKLIINEVRKKSLNYIFKNTYNLLLEKKIILEPTRENFSCISALGKKEYFVLERALVEYLGIRGYGVHLVAYYKEKNNFKIWTPLRSKDKRVEPNKLDNTVAGGISAGESLYQALFRESYEEASLKKKQLSSAVQVGTINYNWRNKKYSLRRDTLFIFDLELPKNIIPKNNDGELTKFKLFDHKKIIEKIKNTKEFKKNCALVLASFFIRRGIINSKNEKDYESICKML